MKLNLSALFFLSFLTISSHVFADNVIFMSSQKPEDIKNIKKYLPQVQIDMRYYGHHNFVGRPIAGYKTPLCLLTKKAINALEAVEHELLLMGLTLKVYDCYRPQQAVNDFINWAKDVNDNTMKAEFFPTVNKQNLLQEGYISYKSAHSRGSTLDVTIVPIDSVLPQYEPNQKLVACTEIVGKRFPDNSLDFGTGFDCFSVVSHVQYIALNEQIKANRLLLSTLMQQAGFVGIETEWWHFTLKNEPYPNTYFNFPIEETQQNRYKSDVSVSYTNKSL
jgi:D-alanyl-D-alanine dipeptidase